MGGREVSLHLHPSLTEVISLLRSKPTLVRVTFWQKGVLTGPWKRGSQGPTSGQAGVQLWCGVPRRLTPALSAQHPPLPAGLGSALSAPAAAASPEGLAASPWASQYPGPGTPLQHPASPSLRKRWAGSLRQREDESLPQLLLHPSPEHTLPVERPRGRPPHLRGVHKGPRPRLLSRALMAA